MDRVLALSTLRLTSTPSREEVIAAYTRLARRYPMSQFPERHSDLLAAKAALLNPETQIRDILMGDSVELSWLANLTTSQKVNYAQGTCLKRRLEIILRPTLMQAASVSSPSDDIMYAIEMMMSKVGSNFSMNQD